MRVFNLKKASGIVKISLAILFSLVLFSSCEDVSKKKNLDQFVKTVMLKFDEQKVDVAHYIYDSNFKKDIKILESNSMIDVGEVIHCIDTGVVEGYKVDKWSINSKFRESPFYFVSLDDAIEENGIWVLHIDYTLCKARPVMIKFDPTHITIKQRIFRKLTEISTGEYVDEDRFIRFEAKNLPAGKKIDKWNFNGRPIIYNFNRVYIKDAIEEDGKKVINVTYTLK